MNVRVKIVDNRLNELSGQLRRLASRAVREELMAITKDVKMDMAQTKSGGLYLRSKTGAPHQASAPGEAPAIDSGALVNSIQTTMDGDLSGAVYTNQEYAMFLEYGTTKMAARPFFSSNGEKSRPRFWARINQILGGLK